MSVRIPAALAEELVAHARAEFPNECCGMLSGNGETVTRVLRARNTEQSPFLYVMDPQEQMDLMDGIDDRDEDLIAIYHSHTKSAAYPSPTDIELAFFPATPYLIVSLAGGEPEIRAFILSRSAPAGEQIREVDVTVEPA